MEGRTGETAQLLDSSGAVRELRITGIGTTIAAIASAGSQSAFGNEESAVLYATGETVRQIGGYRLGGEIAKSGVEKARLRVICDDPGTPCGLSLDGPIDVPAENWTFSSTDSDLPNGKVVFTNTTNILLADLTKPQLTGRLTVTIVDESNVAIPFLDVATLGITTPRLGKYGADIKGTGYKVVALVEVEDSVTSTFKPFLDYYDAASTPDTGDAGGNVYSSFGGSFYDK